MVRRGLMVMSLALIFLLGMSISAAAQQPYIIEAYGPEQMQGDSAIIGIKVADVTGIGWERATVTTTCDGARYDLTEPLRLYDRVGIEVRENTDIVIEVVAPGGTIYTDSRRAHLFEQEPAPDPMPEESISGRSEVENPEPAFTPSPESEDNPAPAESAPEAEAGTPPMPTAGTSTVIDNAVVDGSDREFFTFATPLGNVFYLVIDRNRESENVYFLNSVTERDLLDLAEGESWASESEAATPEPIPVEASEPDPEPEELPAEPEAQTGGSPLILVLVVVVIGAGAGWYFKVYRAKQCEDDIVEYDGGEPIPYDDGDYDEDDWVDDGGGDDAPWDEDDA